MSILDFLTPWRKKQIKGAPLKERSALSGATSIEEINRANPREVNIPTESVAESELYRRLEDERNKAKRGSEEWIQLHEREPNGIPDGDDTLVQEPWFSKGEPPEYQPLRVVDFGQGKKTAQGFKRADEIPSDVKITRDVSAQEQKRIQRKAESEAEEGISRNGRAA